MSQREKESREKKTETSYKRQEIGWMAGLWLGFNGPLREYFSLSDRLSETGRKKRRND